MPTVDRIAQYAVIALAAIATVAALDAAGNILAPTAVALVAGVVLSPISDFWERLGFSSVAGALTSLLLVVAAVATVVILLQPIAVQLVDQAPKVMSDLHDAFETVRGLISGLSEVTDDVTNAIAPEANAAPAEGAAAAELGVPTVADAILIAPTLAGQFLIFAGVLFFFLLTRTEIYAWAARRLSEPANRAITARRLRDAERQVARYFLTITLINAGLGALTAAALTVIGLPGALLWGVVAFLVNYVVYLGPTALVVALLFAGVASFDGGLALMPAGAFLVLNAIEGQFVTPTFVGQQMALNPLLVFLSLVLGMWLWGPLGGIVAIPMLLWVLVLSNTLQPPAEAPQPAARAAA